MPVERKRELPWLVVGSCLVAAGLIAVIAAKTEDFAQAERQLREGTLLNVNERGPLENLPNLLEASGLPKLRRDEVAARLSELLAEPGAFRNIGALRPQLRDTLGTVKPFLVVRTPNEFWSQVLLWIFVYFSGFYVVHVVWRWRRFRGDPVILPALQVLTGIGLIVSFSLRDPLRDTLEFSKFAAGVAAGCLLLLLPLFRFFDYRRYSKQVFTPLLAALAVLAVVFVFGKGPTGNSSKVNVGPVQPIELAKILLVLFMAAYFSAKWEWLRELRERRLPRGLRWINLPRLSHAMPVLAATAFALGMFFALRDLGPALVMACVFLALYGVARNRLGLALAGIGLVVAGVTIGYRMGTPATVAGRISMWLSPWDNDVRGGDQLVHATWAFATGGPFGSGPGRGDPAMIPAGHTDLVLPALAEEWGLPGVVAVALLFGVLCHRSLKIAMSAPDIHGFFLTLGLTALVVIEMLLISAGVLGMLPLTGIVSPFLSSGNSAMLANFLIFGFVLSISARALPNPSRPEFRLPVRVLSGLILAFVVALVAKAATLQTVEDEELLARTVLVYQADGVKRPQRNPRLNSLANTLRRGTIYDRNGIVLAETGQEGRRYGNLALTAHLIGNAATRENFGASNASLIERDQNGRLRGFESYEDLAKLVRYRHRRSHPGIRQLQAKNRDVRTTVDVRLQEKAFEILDRRLRGAGSRRGALVVLHADSGDVLAMVSAPAPPLDGSSHPDELLDRARYGQYPPGSTFKLVTAMAALRTSPEAARTRYVCRPVGGGRVGNRIPGWNRDIRDDAGDPAHGHPDMARALAVSCNAYFAQLGVHSAGSQRLRETAELLGVSTGSAKELAQMLPFASMGQGPVLVTPFQLARVAATVAADGRMPQGRWISDETNPRTDPPLEIITPEQARFLASAMRAVVTSGTGRAAMAGLDVQVAGKTGTAQIADREPHSWFTGFAPFDAPADERIAFAVVVEHGGYGARAAAPIARELVEAARDLGIIRRKH